MSGKDDFPTLFQYALDTLSCPAMSEEAEGVGDSEVDSFNSKVNGKANTLQQRGRNLYIRQSKTFIFYYITLLVVPS